MTEEELPDPEQILTAREAGMIIGATRQGINTLVQRGRIKARLVEQGGVRYYLIKRRDLDEYIANRSHTRNMLPGTYRSSIPS